MSQHLDKSLEAAKALPPISASALILFGFTLNEWVLFGSALLIFLQLVFLLRDKLYKPWKDKRDGVQRCQPGG